MSIANEWLEWATNLVNLTGKMIEKMNLDFEYH